MHRSEIKVSRLLNLSSHLFNPFQPLNLFRDVVVGAKFDFSMQR